MIKKEEIHDKLIINYKKAWSAYNKLESSPLIAGQEKDILTEVIDNASDSWELLNQLKQQHDENSDEYKNLNSNQALLHLVIRTGNEYLDGKTNVRPASIANRVIQALRSDN